VRQRGAARLSHFHIAFSQLGHVLNVIVKLGNFDTAAHGRRGSIHFAR